MVARASRACETRLRAVVDQVSVLVGKYESGKTAFLEALYKSRPLDDVKFDFIAGYPRKDLVR